MAHYFSEVEGKAKTATSRLGTKKSGVKATVASWSGGCKVKLSWSEKHQCDRLFVELIPWHNSGASRLIYDGLISDLTPWEIIQAAGSGS